MGFLNEIKKALFAAKSVSKSAAKKAEEKSKEAGDELKRRSEELYKMSKEKLDNVSDEMKERAEDFFDFTDKKSEELVDKAEEYSKKARDKGKEWSEQAGEYIKKKADDTIHSVEGLFDNDEEEPLASEEPAARESTEPPTAQKEEDDELDFSKYDVPDATQSSKKEEPRDPSAIEELGERVLNSSAKMGHTLLDKSGEAMDKFGELSEKVGGQLMDKGGDLWAKARKAGEELMEKANEEAAREDGKDLDDLTKEAKDLNEDLEENLKKEDRTFMDSSEDLKKSELGKHDDFFTRAQRYAEGDYHNEGEGHMRINKDPDYKKEDKQGRTHGFKDNDGDGDDVIDDAIIDGDDD